MALQSSQSASIDSLPTFLLHATTEVDAEQDKGTRVPEAFVLDADSLVLDPRDSSWVVLPYAGHFFELDVPIAAYLYNSSLHCT